MALGTLSGLKILLNVSLSDVSQDGLLQACLDASDLAIRNWTKRPGLVSPALTYDGVGTDPQPIYLDGTGQQQILVTHRPVVSTTGGGVALAVYEDLGGYAGTAPGAFASTTLLTEGTDYLLTRDSNDPNFLSMSGILIRLRSANFSYQGGMIPYAPYGTLTAGPAGPRWARAWGSIKVVATCGYPAGTVPADLQMAAEQVAAWVKRNGPFGGQEMFASEQLGQYHYALASLGDKAIPAIGGVHQVLAGYREPLW